MGMRTRTGARRAIEAWAIAVSCAFLFAVPAQLSAEGWCDVVFKDVLDEATSVIVAEYRDSAKTSPQIAIREVLKGSCTDAELDLDLEELATHRFKNGDRMIVALTSYHQPVRIVSGMGGCTAVSVLPIRGGKLRARDRMNYDFSSKSISFDALRAELLVLLQPDS